MFSVMTLHGSTATIRRLSEAFLKETDNNGRKVWISRSNFPSNFNGSLPPIKKAEKHLKRKANTKCTANSIFVINSAVCHNVQANPAPTSNHG
jgi:hypothetical protein